MSNEPKLYKDELITVDVETGVDLSDATSLVLAVIKPDGTTDSWTGAIDPSDDSKILYDTTTGDLDQAGRYELNAKADWSGSPQKVGSSTSFRVYELGD